MKILYAIYRRLFKRQAVAVRPEPAVQPLPPALEACAPLLLGAPSALPKPAMNLTPEMEHLLLRLRPLNRALRAAIAKQGQLAARLFRPDVTPLCVTEEQVKTLLGDVDQLMKGEIAAGAPALLTPEEEAVEEALRDRAAESHFSLPLDRLAQALRLTPYEQEAVLLCAAVELDRSYERIYAYILDDLNRRYPCIELLSALTAGSLAERCARREALQAHSKLRRSRVLQSFGSAATELRQELRLAPSLFAYLIGAGADTTSEFYDRAEVRIPALEETELPPETNRAFIERVGMALRTGRVAALGVWGTRHSGQDEVTMAIAAAAGLPLRRLLIEEPLPQGITPDERIREAAGIAAALGAILWIDTDALIDPNRERSRYLSASLADELSMSTTPVILTGIHPWRPAALLGARCYAEIELSAPAYEARQMMWRHALSEASQEQRDDLAARYRLQAAELRAVARVAQTQAWLAGNGAPAPVGDQLERACIVVTSKNSNRFATVIKARRGADDLILPKALHRQVIEVAQFFKAWPRVAESWGFGRLVTGEGGIKALFTGDSGTGKTLAAEVIAHELHMPLLKIDLSRIVSKWVGETEKHLEQAFCEAEDSHAILFFDEADSLFGKRGEVRHGVDRYANMEVSYLLQRLEAYYGLVILASNLRDNIDAAFTRRFQIALHFPRPEPAERLRIWELAFPKSAPLEPGIDFKVLARLDLTGAGIVGAAQTAALLALESEGETGEAVITKSHIVRAIARQYRREARLLTRSELGPYAPLLQEAK
jgi:ATPase family associated with various cellular activities (AAA)